MRPKHKLPAAGYLSATTPPTAAPAVITGETMGSWGGRLMPTAAFVINLPIILLSIAHPGKGFARILCAF